MTLVPLHAAAVFATGDPVLGAALRAALPEAAAACGDRVEVDTTRLPGGKDLARWWQRCEHLWDAARRGDVDGLDWVRTRRTLLDARQSTTKGAKADLHEHLEALTALPAVRELVLEATAAEPDASTCRTLAGALGGSYRVDADAARCTFTVTGTQLLPGELGGHLWPGEVLRRFTVETRHASWRDRRVRRLARVHVEVDELWAGLDTPA